MLLPESMSRVLIVGNRARMEMAIKALYDIGQAHLIDYSDDDDEGFQIGRSLPNAAMASDRLVKLRAMEKELGVKEEKLPSPISVKEIRQLIDSEGVEQLEQELFAVVDTRNEFAQRMADLESGRDALLPLKSLPLSLEDYAGYDSLAVLVGKARQDPSTVLSGIEHELFYSEESKITAVFVAKEAKDDALKALSAVGFQETGVPAGSGSPADTIVELDVKIAELAEKKATIDAKMKDMKDKHLSFLLASEEELAIETEMASTPLRVATSDHSFVMDAWVPTRKVEDFQKRLEDETEGVLHVDILETRSRDLHDSEHQDKKFQLPPTKSDNGPIGKKYEWFVKMISAPRYQESDPSLLFAFTWPLFFGLMVGDVGYAIAFLIMGWFMTTRFDTPGMQGLGTQALFGGVWSLIFGLFLFGEFFGMHFVDFHPGATSTDWQTIIGYFIAGFQFPAWLASETGFSLTINMGKFYDVTTFLKLSVFLGIAHLFFGFLVGFFNVKRQHGTTMAVYEKFSFIMMLFGLVMISFVISEVMFAGAGMEGTLLSLLAVGAVLLFVGLGLAFKVEGINAILETPGIIGNILSYTRLTAIALSKAGIAMAFNYMAIFLIFLGMGGIIGVVFGFVVFMIGHILVFLLAILSCGLHGIRLHYVELMSKFFKGGGVEYDPLAINRLNTKNTEKEVY